MNPAATRRWASVAVTAFVLLYLAAVAVKVARDPKEFGVNFRVYYHAAAAFSKGLNPYDAEVLAKEAGADFILPYVYPPITLNLFRPLPRFDYATSWTLYVAAKCAAVLVLVVLWLRGFLQTRNDPVFLLFCLFAFNYTIYGDVANGNIIVFQDLVLWAGLYAYVKRRFNVFVACIVLASVFKMTPIYFLGLLVLAEDSDKWKRLAVGAAAFGVLMAASPVLYPEMTRDYRENMSKMTGVVRLDTDTAKEEFAGSPTTWPLIKTISDRVFHAADMEPNGLVAAALYGMFAISVFGLTLWGVHRSGEVGEARAILAVALATLVYLMILPRTMTYGFVTGLFPAYYCARRLGPITAPVALLGLALVSTLEGRPPGLNMAVEMLTPYWTLLTVYAAWAAGMYPLIVGASAAQWTSPRR